MNEILQAAIDFYDAGISVIPAKDDGTKAPIGNWAKYQVERATLEQLADWFGSGHTGIGIVTGAV
jgi:putative DNA primase/helicase